MSTVKLQVSWSETIDCSAVVELPIPEGSTAEDVRNAFLDDASDTDWINKRQDEKREVEERIVLTVEIVE
jgi:hypothetical protein